jgi:hypothetical protein
MGACRVTSPIGEARFARLAAFPQRGKGLRPPFPATAKGSIVP